MKKKIALMLLLFAGQFSMLLQAQTIYVNAGSVLASDSNDGDDPCLPWETLNARQWQDGMVLEVAPGVYTVNAVASPKSITINGMGDNPSDVIIQGLNPVEYAEGTMNIANFSMFKFHNTNTVNLTMKNLTVQNISTNANGAAFYLFANSTLNLDSVVVKKAKTTGGRSGGAIYNNGGTLNASNTLFEECYAAIAGAVFAAPGSKNTFTNCRFINNGNLEALTNGSCYGGAISMNESAEVNINACYFKENKTEHGVNASTQAILQGTGGAIYIRCGTNTTTKLSISNSTFYRNQSEGASSVLHVTVGTSGNSDQDFLAFDLTLTNNTFLENKGNTSANKNTNTIEFFASAKVRGNFLSVNNTFLNNNNPDYPAARSIWLPNTKLQATLINNIFLDGDNTIQADNSVTNRPPIIARGNVISKPAGSINATNDPELYATENYNRLNETNASVLLATALTEPAAGVPYLALQAGSSAIDNGIDAYTVNEVNVVPALDVRGQATVNKKDAGAYEFKQETTGIDHPEDETVLTLTPNPFKDAVVLPRTVDKIDFFDVSGRNLLSVSRPGATVYTGNLPKGVYLVVVSFENKSVTVKLVK
ncbi:MAG: T9SS type A sorting domain-containing protein [Tannerella sp.]|jgi:hypothetical protein|nr:T9SS type A sorting domain-containing protein [Tannerella sp.]